MAPRCGSLAALLVVLCSACGDESGFLVEVSASCAEQSCTIPDQVDEIWLQVSKPASTQTPDPAELSSAHYPLSRYYTFPVTILVQAGEHVPERLREHVTLLHDERAVGERSVEHPWTRGEVRLVRINVDVSP